MQSDGRSYPVLWSPCSLSRPLKVFFPGGRTTSAGSPQSRGAVARHRGPFGSLSSSPCHELLTLTCSFAVSSDVDLCHPSEFVHF